MFSMDPFMLPAACREEARKCRELGDLPPAELRQAYLATATAWDQLADQYEKLEALRLHFLRKDPE
jgi:hypothetical protein